MKNIFIATDFSEASRNAAVYGIELAKLLSADVILFNAYHAPVHVPESYLLYNAEDEGAAVELRLKEEAEWLKKEKGVDVHLLSAEGGPAGSIIMEAKKSESSLILCGMKVHGKTIRKIFGSTVTELMKKSDLPFMVIPEKYSFNGINRIAFASDLDPETSVDAVHVLKEISEKTASQLSVVRVVSEGFNPGYEMRFHPLGFLQQLKSLNPVFEFPAGDTVTEVLNGYLKEKDIDLLAMMPHKHDFFERFILESTTKKMIYLSDKPILIMPQKKKDISSEQLINKNNIAYT